MKNYFKVRFITIVVLSIVFLTISSMSLKADESDTNVVERIAVTKELKVKRYGSPEEIDVPVGASFEVVDYGSEKNKIHLFDSHGNQVQGVYEMSTQDLQDYVHLQAMGDDLSENAANEEDDSQEADDTDENGLQAGEDFPLLPESDMGEYMPDAAPIDEAFAPTQDICSLYKKFAAKGVPAVPLKQVLFFYKNHQSQITNKKYVSFGDYSQRSNKRRFYLLDMQTGNVQMEKVSHGSGSVGGGRKSGFKRRAPKKTGKRSSVEAKTYRGLASITMADPDNDGMIDRCTHPASSPYRGTSKNMTRPGFYLTRGYAFSPNHKSKWPWLGKGVNKVILNGLSPSNSEALSAGVVMHGAFYNRGGDVIMGKSFGCPAFVPDRAVAITSKIYSGSLFYAYVPQCKSETNEYKAQVNGWQNFCGGGVQETVTVEAQPEVKEVAPSSAPATEAAAAEEKPADQPTAAAPAPVVVKKAPVKKAPVKKAPVKKAAPAKAPAKKAPVKKAPVKKPVAKKPVTAKKTLINKPVATKKPAPAKKRVWSKKYKKYIYVYEDEATGEEGDARMPASENAQPATEEKSE